MEEAAIFDVSREPVILNIYDMFWTNDYTANVGLGVYHSGLEVYGREYAYGKNISDFYLLGKLWNNIYHSKPQPVDTARPAAALPVLCH